MTLEQLNRIARESSQKQVKKPDRLTSTHRPEQEKDRVQTPESVMRGNAALKQLLALRDSL